MTDLLAPALQLLVLRSAIETAAMVAIAAAIALAVGLPMALTLALTAPGQPASNALINRPLGLVVHAEPLSCSTTRPKAS